MRKTTNTAGWKRAMAHAWLGFILLLAFYLLTFGLPPGIGGARKGEQPAKAWEGEEGKAPVVLSELHE